MSSGAAIFAPPHRKITSSDLRQKPQSINENETETSQSQTSFISAANRIRSTRISKVLPTSTKILPTVGHKLSDWLEFPADEGRHSVIVNSFTLPFKWLLFTSKGLAGLPPGSGLRERLCNQSSSLGSVAGLYLVIAISAFLMPPTSKHPMDDLLVDIYGILMFFSAMALTVYICLSLTVMYPLLESIPDFAAYEAYVGLSKRWGGYELYLFNFGCQGTLLALLVAAKVVYSVTVFLWMVGIFLVLYCIAAFMTREFFLAIDPITSMHMGLTNGRDTLRRATRLASAITRRHKEFSEQGEDNRSEVRAIHYMDDEEVEEGGKIGLFASGLSGAVVGDSDRRLTDSSRNSGSRSAHLTSGGGVGGGRGFEGVVVSALEKDRLDSSQHHSGDKSTFGAERPPSDMVKIFDPQLDNEEEEDKEDRDDNDQRQDFKITTNSAVKSALAMHGARSRSRSSSYEASTASPKAGHHKQTRPSSSSSPKISRGSVKSHNATTGSTTGRNQRAIPDLETLFLGDSRLITAISSEEGEVIHNALLSQGCRDIEQLVMLLKWQQTVDRDRERTELDPSKCMSLCMHMRIPLFPFMEVVYYLSQYLS